MSNSVISIRLETEDNVSIKAVNIIGKTINLICFLRAGYNVLKEKLASNYNFYSVYDLSKPGLYVLISNDNSIYIGQSDNVLDRLNNHYSNPEKTEYWVNTLVFMAEGNASLNISQIKYLESKLISLARNASEVEVGDENAVLSLKNKQISNIPNINSNDLIVADNFLMDILILTKALGIKYFEYDFSSINDANDETGRGDDYIFIIKLGNQISSMKKSGDKYIILKGSYLKYKVQDSCKNYISNKRSLLLLNGVIKKEGEFYIAEQDIVCDSSSTAASLVCARSSNGRVEWKSSVGKSLKELGL